MIASLAQKVFVWLSLSWRTKKKNNLKFCKRSINWLPCRRSPKHFLSLNQVGMHARGCLTMRSLFFFKRTPLQQVPPISCVTNSLENIEWVNLIFEQRLNLKTDCCAWSSVLAGIVCVCARTRMAGCFLENWVNEPGTIIKQWSPTLQHVHTLRNPSDHLTEKRTSASPKTRCSGTSNYGPVVPCQSIRSVAQGQSDNTPRSVPQQFYTLWNGGGQAYALRSGSEFWENFLTFSRFSTFSNPYTGN